MFGAYADKIVEPDAALKGRAEPIERGLRHFITGVPLDEMPEGSMSIQFGMGCFWGAERKFWQLGEAVWSTAVGYAGGFTPNPTYEEVCSGRTGHAEVVRVVYLDRPQALDALLKVFWESHDPTQGMRQGNDRGTQYRSAVYCENEEQLARVERSLHHYQTALSAGGYGKITTELRRGPTFYFAEGYHQQYLAKNPHGYCGLGGTGVACVVGTDVKV